MDRFIDGDYTLRTQDPLNSLLFKQWQTDLAATGFKTGEVTIQSVDYVIRDGHPVPIFIKCKADIIEPSGGCHQRIIFLRGPSVALLVVLETQIAEYAILITQTRAAIGRADYPELPAGMSDGGAVRLAAIRELKEETGLDAADGDLIDLCQLFYGGNWQGVYPSPGACDERVHLFLFRKRVSEATVNRLHDKRTGSEIEHEQLVLKVIRLDDLCTATPDPKAHSAFMMYQSLRKKGVIQ